MEVAPAEGHGPKKLYESIAEHQTKLHPLSNHAQTGLISAQQSLEGLDAPHNRHVLQPSIGHRDPRLQWC